MNNTEKSHPQYKLYFEVLHGNIQTQSPSVLPLAAALNKEQRTSSPYELHQ